MLHRTRAILLICISAALAVSALPAPGLTWSPAQGGSSGNCRFRKVPSEDVGPYDNVLEDVAAVAPDDVWAVGRRDPFPYRTLVQHWDGSHWSAVDSPNGSEQSNFLVSVSAAAPDSVWAVGHYFSLESNEFETLVLRWDGLDWTIVPSRNPGGRFNEFRSVAAIAPDDVWAVGSMLGPDMPLIEHWDGRRWSVVPGGHSEGILDSVSAVSSDDVWAVGADTKGPTAQHWDGTAWRSVLMPQVAGGPYDVFARASDDVWAVGVWYDPHIGSQTLVLHWDGIQWAIVPSPNVWTGSNRLLGVAADAADNAWAVGDYQAKTGHVMFQHWDGESWQAAYRRPLRSKNSLLLDVAMVPGGDVWAVGYGPGQSNSLIIKHECLVP